MDVKAALMSLYKSQDSTIVNYNDSTNGAQKAPAWLIAKCALEDIRELEELIEGAREALRKERQSVSQ